jgi:hypothetical protein
MSDFLVLDGSSTTNAQPMARSGLVASDRKAVQDDAGHFFPLGLTFFWALYGWKYERARILEHLSWIKTKGYDYLRILTEVDWEGRSIDPNWDDYTTVLQEFVDTAYDGYGLRCEVTIIGGLQFDVNTGARRFDPRELAATVADALKDRGEKVMLFEMANEWDNGWAGYAEKASIEEMMDMAAIVMDRTTNLVSLSCPAADDYESMKEATALCGATSFTPHIRRSDHDNGWSHVRQGYDFKDFDRVTWNNEPEGPQSSVESMDNPLQLACTRLLGIICGGAGYVLHVAQGVTGKADAAHGRPENMWEVPNIDHIMDVVRNVDTLLPDGIENWKCVNNGRDDHPLPVPDDYFWEGDHPGPALNKNYAAISDAEFVVMLIGVKSAGETGPVSAGTAKRACHVEAIDPVTLECVVSAELAAGQSWTVPGRGDTMAAYVVRGRYV